MKSFPDPGWPPLGREYNHGLPASSFGEPSQRAVRPLRADSAERLPRPKLQSAEPERYFGANWQTTWCNPFALRRDRSYGKKSRLDFDPPAADETDYGSKNQVSAW